MMAGHISFLLKLSTIVLAINCHLHMISNMKVAAELMVEPLWQIVENNISSPCILDVRHDNSNMLRLQGTSSQTCSLQITASQDSLTLLKLPDKTEQFMVYIEREECFENMKCENRFVLIKEGLGDCDVIMAHTRLKVHLQGNVNVLIDDILKANVNFFCPETNFRNIPNRNDSEIVYCPHSQVIGYKKQITCTSYDDSNEKACRLNFDSNCKTNLYNREVEFECFRNDNNTNYNEKVLIFYPVGLTSLDINSNNITSINNSPFMGLHDLKVLNIGSNKIVTLTEDVFWGLDNVQELHLNDNELKDIHKNSFEGLLHLQILDLGKTNNIESLPDYVFRGLSNLKKLFLRYNQLHNLDVGIFKGLDNLTYLNLFDNKLKTLPLGLLSGLTNLNDIFFDFNMIESVPLGLFSDQQNLSNGINLASNSLKELPLGLFSGLHKMWWLVLEKNQLSTLHKNMFDGLHSLKHLLLTSNNFSTLHPQIFFGLSHLHAILLAENNFTEIPDDFFNDLSLLKRLYLAHNRLKYLNSTNFKGLVSLEYLFLKVNNITKIDSTTFQDLVNLIYLDLSFNHLRDVPGFNYSSVLVYMNLVSNPLLQVNLNSFVGFPKYAELIVSQHEICECYKPYNCTASSDRSPYLTCDRLLSDRVLVVMMWLIGLNALFGNMFVLMWRKKNTKKAKFQDMLLGNLALSDFLMGGYMIILGSADIYFNDKFPLEAETWRSGITCRIAGAISIISSEASVFFVTLISIDRYIGIKYPMSTKKLGKKLTLAIILATWIVSVALGVVPSVLAAGEKNFKFYDNSHVCIGLPLALTKSYTTTTTREKLDFEGQFIHWDGYSTKYEGLITGMFFSSALFLGLNCVCYLVILICYIYIVSSVQKSSKQSGRTVEMSEQIKLTTKVTAIVGTDFLCWFPIIILGILVQTRVLTLPPAVYAWAVTFVLPINSGINPYLYTISDVISSYRKEKAKTKRKATIIKTAN